MKDPGTEQYLNNGGYKHHYRDKVPFTEIDMDLSENNPARILRKLDPEVACQYAIDMEAGNKFPAIVLLNHPNPDSGRKWVIATGVHRTKAADMIGVTYFDAYCVTEADTYRRDHLVRSLNRIVGHGMTQDEILIHILAEHDANPSIPWTQLARDWAQKPNIVLNAARERDARLRARRLSGIDFERQKVPATTQLVLQSIANDIVFDKAAELFAYTSGLTTEHAKEMAQEIKRAKDEKSQLAVVAARKEKADAEVRARQVQHGRTKSVAAQRVQRNIKALNNQFSRPLNELHLGMLEDLPDQILLAKRLKENIDRYIAELERADLLSRRPDQAA